MPFDGVPKLHKPKFANIDWSNPLTQGLVALYLVAENGTILLDYFNHYDMDDASLGTWSQDDKGEYLSFNGSSNYAATQGGHSFAYPATFLFYGHVDSTTAARKCLFGLGTKASAFTRYMGITAEYSKFRYFSYTPNSFNFAQTGTFTAGQDHMVCGVSRASNAHELYIDGALDNTDTSSVTSNLADLDAPCMGALVYSSSKTYYAQMGARLCAYWSRDLSQDEIKAIYDNPWQLFEKEESWYYVPSVGGGTTYTFSVSGGLSMAGSVPLIRVRNQVASGGISTGGTGLENKIRVMVPSGGITHGGTGLQLHARIMVPSGGLSAGGTATTTKTKVFGVSGGLTLAGSATFAYHTSVKVLSVGGGITLSGTSVINFISSLAATDWITFVRRRRR